jgi:hypothetical protein
MLDSKSLDEIEQFLRVIQGRIDSYFERPILVAHLEDKERFDAIVERLRTKAIYHAEQLGKSLSELNAWHESELIAHKQPGTRNRL